MGSLADPAASNHYQNAMSDLHKQLRRPNLQRSVFSFAKTSPSDLVRSKLSTSEIQYRALTYIPDQLLANIPDDDNVYSLFQGFQATLPEASPEQKRHRRRVSRGRKLLEDDGSGADTPPSLAKLKKEKHTLNHQFEMLGVRKNMASSEIHEIDSKIANLNSMRKIVLDRLANLEQEEAMLEHDSRYSLEMRWMDADEFKFWMLKLALRMRRKNSTTWRLWQKRPQELMMTRKKPVKMIRLLCLSLYMRNYHLPLARQRNRRNQKQFDESRCQFYTSTLSLGRKSERFKHTRTVLRHLTLTSHSEPW